MKEGVARTTQAMRAYQEAAREKVIERIHKGLADLEAEVRAHDGAFPAGKLTRKALCARAGVGESTLKNPTHAVTRKRVDDCLERLRRTARPRLPVEASPPPSEKPSASRALKAMAMQLDSANRRICELEAESREMALRIESLEQPARRRDALWTA